MNFIAISPNFPPNYHQFWRILAERGVNLLGLGDTPYDELDPNLRPYLTEYFYLPYMMDQDAQTRAVAFLTYKHGKINRLESHNEFWLESDASLRSDFNITGFHREDMPQIKQKSLMKAVFQSCGVPVARGKVIDNLAEAMELVAEVGYPIVAKPDVGVGANQTFTLLNESELEYFFKHKNPSAFILEEYIRGVMVTYDGLTDQDGNVVYDSSLVYSNGIMETVNQSSDIWYYVDREVPEELRAIGAKILRADNVRERFFHLEFFRLPNGELYGLEVNMRPPGGLTTDMWNYANDIDIYEQYANVVLNNEFTAKPSRANYCAYVSRRFNKEYHYSVEEIFREFGEHIVMHTSIDGVFAPALGDYGFILKAADFSTMELIVSWIMKPREISLL